MKRAVSKPFLDKRGVQGSTVRVEFGPESGLCGHYRILSHGLTVAEVQAKIAKLEEHHAKKSARYFGFDEMRGAVVGRFRIVTATVREQGTNVMVRIVLADGSERIKIDRVYADMDAVPVNAALIALAQDEAAERDRANAGAKQEAAVLAAAIGAVVDN